MNKFKFYFILSFISLTLFSCDKDDDTKLTPPRDRAEQYVKDLDSIEKYLKTHYLNPIVVDGMVDVEIIKIPTGGTQVSIWDNTDYPLKSKIVKNDNRSTNFTDGRVDDAVDYKLYYLILNEGGGDRAATVDSVYTTYRGWKLDNVAFDNNNSGIWSTFPALTSGESAFISGYRQFIPEIKASTSAVTNPDGTISYVNTGAGVVFIPSGLGYFNESRPSLPAYSPLVFTIRLHSVFYRDHDRDGIKSFNEDLNHDGDYYNDDTDGDTAPDFLDVDDDEDMYLTKAEIRNAAGQRYEFDLIPNCQNTTGGLKRYLDPSCFKDPE